ncbi:MAG: aminomethyl-transferring glycine dehydrogenase subunit GcvPA [Erysipelotrichaceae bacterium]|nr:aminomethyl-transferring glycine dehydrogenase subunit GcvPA [Erysipelotrichaceae bacterium]
MSYIPNTAKDIQKMLDAIGIKSVDELFVDVPSNLRANELKLESGKSELEVRSIIEELAQKNKKYNVIFRGAGSYDHYIPSIVKTVTTKEEFVTAYTPYQAEISQGVLQSIFEYQTMICELTGMDVSNASVYDGAVAAAEAVMMTQERKRTKVVVTSTIDPQVLTVVKTYCEGRNIPVEVVEVTGKTNPEAIKSALGSDAACFLFQQPNYFGVIEDAESLVAAAHETGAKVIMSVNPIAMGLLKTPGECGADIAVGEGQPLGMPMAFGGPYLGFMASTKAMMRKLPGRIVGQTEDDEGRRAFVLTLQAREQHIRREKASSNVCSNEALCAMTAAVYMSAMGPEGLANCAETCFNKAHYAASQLSTIPGMKLVHNEEFFHEFLMSTPVDPKTINKALAAEGILGGLPVEGNILWCVTEKQTKAQIDRMVAIVKEVCA